MKYTVFAYELYIKSMIFAKYEGLWPCVLKAEWLKIRIYYDFNKV